MRRLAMVMVAASAMIPGRATPLPAQAAVPVPLAPPLLARDLNNLNFGDVLPGISHTVLARDGGHAGLFEVRGPSGASVRIEFNLPAFLISVPGDFGPGGAQLPVTFGLSDGLVGYRRDPNAPGMSFDPHAAVIGTLSPEGLLYLRMGGTAVPGRPQAGGVYRAVIFMTVYNLGS